MRFRAILFAAAAAVLLIAGAGVVTANRGLPSPMMWSEDSLHAPGPVGDGDFAVQQRGYFSITAQFHTSGLTPGHRYTIWWVTYNNPGACVGGCGLDDVATAIEGEDTLGIGVQYGGTFVAQPNGRIDSGTRILENTVIACLSVQPYASLCEPMLDAATAEATLFINDHGPATDEPPPPATEAFAAGCKTYTRLGAAVATYGPVGFDCFTAQEVHLP
jgi:hypothetical protein